MKTFKKYFFKTLITITLPILIFTFYNLINTCIASQKENKLINEYFSTHIYKEKLNNKDSKNSYIGLLEIPKIKLMKGFYNIESSQNNVNKNIEVIKNSTMPNQNNSILVLAAHSGYGKHAYFSNLTDLILNDEINIYLIKLNISIKLQILNYKIKLEKLHFLKIQIF